MSSRRRSRWAKNGGTDVLLVCSSGGRLLELWALRDAWDGRSRAWVTFDKSDARSLLRDEEAVYARWPTERNIANLFRNSRPRLARDGAAAPARRRLDRCGIAVPFSWVARMRGAHVVYIESLARIDKPSLSCRLLRPAADRIYVQWPELAESYDGARYAGTVV